MRNSHLSALTIDVEDGINISMYDNFKVKMEPTSRVVDNVEVILDICEKNSVTGTFFILGEIAKNYPELIRRIDSLGHEIGVHGYRHHQIFRLSPEKLREDLKRARGQIGELIGKEIDGFRAPAFSINAKTAWALPIIAESGFTYDSSIFPSLSLRYGWKGFSKDICRIELDHSNSLVEVPLSVVRLFGRDIPVGGGGYLRYFPYDLTRKAISKIVRQRPAIFYLHPYELDTKKYPDYFHEAVSKAPMKKRALLSLYRFKKDTVATKLDRITKEFKITSMREIIQKMDERQKIPNVKLNIWQ
ncbi:MULTISPECIES: polysaccharide deacetylase family protein [unclassified Carboxylicivirga]|uniref:polysaccharide deacetylase family protein n=1 Tax=Carboxylicivirga TaxID=1628153 RepID=UPI003D327C49